MAGYIMVVQMDIPAELEEKFNHLYDTQHVPNILTVKGVHGCDRYKLESSDAEGMARYSAIYHIDSPDIPNTPEWKEQSDKGEWATEIRPYATNRARSFFKSIN